MNKETISDKQGTALIVLFLTGTSTSYIIGGSANESFWLSIILAVFFSVPTVSIYIYLSRIFPGKDLIYICQFCFGRYIGKIISSLFIWYAFFQGTHRLMDVVYFTRLTALSSTPKIVIMSCIILLCIWIIKAGFDTIAKVAELFLLPFILFIFFEIFLLVPQMDFNNLHPVLYHGIRPVLKGAFEAFTYPFGDILISVMIFTGFKTKKSSFNIYTIGLSISSIIVLLGTLTNVLVLNINIGQNLYFPIYSAAARINIGDFLQRVELVIPVVFLLGSFITLTLFIFAVCKGITKITECKDYKVIVIPVTLLMICFSYTLHYGIVDYFQWYYNVWHYYFFPFQFFLPLIVLIGVKIKRRVSKL